MSPALVGLVLAVPVSRFMGSARAGRVLVRLGLLATPEERRPPPLAGAAEKEAEALRASDAPPVGVAELLADPPALARHLAWLDAPTARPLGTPDANLASALLKLADGLGPDRLDPREAFAVLASARTLSELADDRPESARDERFVISARGDRHAGSRSSFPTPR